jgi:DNA-binding MarR family transcriptional regulator
MTIKLTRRQQEFLSQFLDAYRDLDEPVHYTQLAKKLGIGKVTAYEMLRLLEDRGLVQAEFLLPEEDRGPGRSSVVFSPTPAAHQLLDPLLLGDDHASWEENKLALLEQLRLGKADGYEPLLEDLLAKIPGQPSPMLYLTEMVTATMLMLESMGEAVNASHLFKRLQRIGLPDEIDLSGLPGMSMVASMVEHASKASEFLVAQSGKFQTRLAQIGEENYRHLGDFAREVAKILHG